MHEDKVYCNSVWTKVYRLPVLHCYSTHWVGVTLLFVADRELLS